MVDKQQTGGYHCELNGKECVSYKEEFQKIC